MNFEDYSFFQTYIPGRIGENFKFIRCGENNDKFLIDLREAKLLSDGFALTYTEFRWIRSAFLSDGSNMHQLIGKDRVLTVNNRVNEEFALSLKEKDKPEIKIVFNFAEFRALFCDKHKEICDEIEEMANKFHIPLSYDLSDYDINVYD